LQLYILAMPNASEVHEKDIFTPKYKTLTPLFIQNLTINGEQDAAQEKLK